MQGKLQAVIAIYLLSSILLAVHILWFTGKLRTLPFTNRPFLPLNETSGLFLDNIHIIFFAIYFLLSIVVLFHSLVRMEAPELKQQMKWIVGGITVSLVPFFFLYVLPFLLNLRIRFAWRKKEGLIACGVRRMAKKQRGHG